MVKFLICSFPCFTYQYHWVMPSVSTIMSNIGSSSYFLTVPKAFHCELQVISYDSFCVFFSFKVTKSGDNSPNTVFVTLRLG